MSYPDHIPGGYFIVARQLLDSSMMDAPPLHWKLWCWMLGEANWKDRGKIKRGQFMTTINAMREAMSWRVGFRVERPSSDQIRSAYEAFTKASMITTAKTTRGMIITILNYKKYQTQKNYETHSDPHDETRTKPEITPPAMEARNKDTKYTTHPPTNGPQPMGPAPDQSNLGDVGKHPFSSLPQDPPEYSFEFLQFMEAYGEDPNDGAWASWGRICSRKDFISSSVMANLADWQDSDQWARGYAPCAKNFLREGYWQRKPQQQGDTEEDNAITRGLEELRRKGIVA